ncbi:YvbH-like oligomerization domain-containing protein [Brevibacillus brevis]|uniref:YvbH-like oligomerization domain-containing protein n=1 Tax=Brevibacillus brevis TaxID=1393 RepID=UPI0037BE4646
MANLQSDVAAQFQSLNQYAFDWLQNAREKYVVKGLRQSLREVHPQLNKRLKEPLPQANAYRVAEGLFFISFE